MREIKKRISFTTSAKREKKKTSGINSTKKLLLYSAKEMKLKTQSDGTISHVHKWKKMLKCPQYTSDLVTQCSLWKTHSGDPIEAEK